MIVFFPYINFVLTFRSKSEIEVGENIVTSTYFAEGNIFPVHFIFKVQIVLETLHFLCVTVKENIIIRSRKYLVDSNCRRVQLNRLASAHYSPHEMKVNS